MNRIITICATILMTASIFAQTPEKISYQAVIRDSADELVTNTQVGMQISILQGTANGSAVYVETQTPTTNVNGLVSVEIGTGTTSADFTSIDWAAGPYFIKTETDPTGGTTYSITGTSQLMSVPYALYAKSAESVDETDPEYTQSEAANITASDITNLGNLSGTNTGDQDLSGYLTTETDPAYTQSEAAKITASDITNLGNLSGTNTGDQDLSGYLTAEADPAYTQSEAAKITASDITNLGNLSGTNTGDQDLSGYLTAETDPEYTQSEAANITASDITNLGNLSGTNTGDQDLSGYLTAETDPEYTQSEAANITASDITNLGNLSGTNTGDQDLSGYLTAETDPTVTANFDLTTPADGDVLQYDANAGKWIKRTISGDITIDNTGVSAVGSDKVLTQMIADGTILAEDLATDAVETTKIKDSNITTEKIADASITSIKLADGGVTSAKIADNAVGTNSLKDASVTIDKLANFDLTNANDGDLLQYNASTEKWVKVKPGYISNGDNNVGIGIITPDPSAELEVNSTTKGFLPPRLTNNKRDEISNPAEGLMIFNTTSNKFQGYSNNAFSSSLSIVANSSVKLTDTYVKEDEYTKDYPAQSFRVNQSTKLESISFSVAKLYNDFSSGNIFFNLKAGLPGQGSTQLFSALITINQINIIEVGISSYITLHPDIDYFFELVPAAPFYRGWFSVHRSNGATPGEHTSGSLYYYMDYGYMYGESNYTESGVDDLWFDVKGYSCCEPGWVDLH